MASRNLPEETTIDEPDIATQKLNELRERAKKDFSTDEVESFIAMGRKLASKSVLSSLICLLKEGPDRGLDKKVSARLAKEVAELMPYDYSGFTSISFKEVPHILNLCLSLVDRGYKTDVMIPHDSYAKDLFAQYDFLKNIAIAYWRQFAGEQPELYKEICDYMCDVDFSNLLVDDRNPTVMYWDVNQKKYIGLFAYYMLNGKPFYKTGGQNKGGK
jgi:hypothetical protein